MVGDFTGSELSIAAEEVHGLSVKVQEGAEEGGGTFKEHTEGGARMSVVIFLSLSSLSLSLLVQVDELGHLANLAGESVRSYDNNIQHAGVSMMSPSFLPILQVISQNSVPN